MSLILKIYVHWSLEKKNLQQSVSVSHMLLVLEFMNKNCTEKTVLQTNEQLETSFIQYKLIILKLQRFFQHV